jgi:threonine dehydratase
VAVKRVGDRTFTIAQSVIDEMVVVSNDAICGAIKEIFEDRRAILEPAGALAYAGLCEWVSRHHAEGLNLAVIACGANVNFDTLRHVSERAELGENREAILAVTIPEQPGSFRAFCRAIGDRSITEFNYRYAPAAEAQVFVGIRTTGPDSSGEIVQQLAAAGFATADLSRNETAKLHVRHMVGGRAPVENERLFSFVFPERVGALAKCLDAMEHPWNISLFHYRNHGSDYGRVLCGIQVPESEEGDLTAFLARLGYEWQEETENIACTRFLR